MNDALLIAMAGLAGLVAGSFLTVVVHRLPLMLDAKWRREAALAATTDGNDAHELAADDATGPNLIAPRSHCPHCLSPIPWHGLVPLVGFALLRGRCAHCATPIGWRYPIIELLTAFAAMFAVAWFAPAWFMVGGAFALTGALIALACIDRERRLLPDAITLPMLWAGLAFNLTAGGASGSGSAGFVPLADAVLGAMAGYGVLRAVQEAYRWVRRREGLGTGDLKLAAMLGAWFGWEALPGLIFIAALGGLANGLVNQRAGHEPRGAPFAFGPWLALAGWLTLVNQGEPLSRLLPP